MPPFEMTPRTYEAVSALQKCIRRSDEEGAGYWFTWLADNGFVHIALGRLLVIAHEDIGLADPMAVMFVQAAVERSRDWIKAKNDSWRLSTANAVLMLCRAKKSREADHFQAAMRSRVELDPDREVPDFALDKHTMRGRRMGRGLEHFRREGSVLEPAHTDRYEDEAYSYWQRHFGKPKPSGNDAATERTPRLFDADGE